MRNVTHFPWDNGAITELFGPVIHQKTVKTICEKRVPFSSVVFKPLEITCMDCLRELANEENFQRDMLSRHPDWPNYFKAEVVQP